MSRGGTLIAIGAALGVVLLAVWLGDRRTDPDRSPRSEDFERQLRALGERVATLEHRLEQRSMPVPADPAAPRRTAVTATPDLEALVRHLVAEHVTELRGAAPPPADDGLLQRALADLSAAPDDAAAQAIWQQLADAGALDLAVEELRTRAAAAPASAEARVDLGQALVQQLLRTSSPDQRRQLGEAADTAFSEALELDPTSWRARFRKAEGLAHWPAASGVRAEAIRHFEVLVEQQRTMGRGPRQAQTYVYLANLYEQTGNAEKAASVRAEGLARHPDDEQLRRAAHR